MFKIALIVLLNIAYASGVSQNLDIRITQSNFTNNVLSVNFDIDNTLPKYKYYIDLELRNSKGERLPADVIYGYSGKMLIVNLLR